MIRLLHIVAIAALIGSAVYAYSIKYETLFQAERVAKLKSQIARERDGIGVLQAEWSHLNKPDRLQAAVDRHLPEMQPLGVHQLARISDLPLRPERGDEIGKKLELLGLIESTTPKDKRAAGEARTPTSTGSLPRSAAPAR